nr:MAG TPA: hypothetical protein [Caudoviricetes sp.]DAO98322.1 MAG TPA: hypothetical protein [Caudoviricetes sp.]
MFIWNLVSIALGWLVFSFLTLCIIACVKAMINVIKK